MLFVLALSVVFVVMAILMLEVDLRRPDGGMRLFTLPDRTQIVADGDGQPLDPAAWGREHWLVILNSGNVKYKRIPVVFAPEGAAGPGYYRLDGNLAPTGELLPRYFRYRRDREAAAVGLLVVNVCGLLWFPTALGVVAGASTALAILAFIIGAAGIPNHFRRFLCCLVPVSWVCLQFSLGVIRAPGATLLTGVAILFAALAWVTRGGKAISFSTNGVRIVKVRDELPYNGVSPIPGDEYYAWMSREFDRIHHRHK